MVSRRPSIALLLAVCSSACMPGATIKPPQAPVRGELAPSTASIVVPTEDGPLQVVFASPRNNASAASEINVVFNQAMRRVGDTSAPLAYPLVISPPVSGKISWAGTTALRFVPDKPLPRATAFTVEVPKGTTSPLGKVLAEPYRFSFTTERPAITGSVPETKATTVVTTAPITLYFNQPIAAAELSRVVSISANKQPIPFDISEIQADFAVLTPRQALPRDTNVQVHVDASLHGTEGELTMGEAKDIQFRTLGPFAVSKLECQPHPSDKAACDPIENDLRMTLTTPLPSDLWEQAVFVTPTLDSVSIYETGGEENGPSEVLISGSFEPGKTYTVGVRNTVAGKPLRDIHGQLVASIPSRTVRFGDWAPEVTIGAHGIYWEPGKHSLPIGVLNTPEASVAMLPLRRDEVLERLVGQKKPLAALETAPRRTINGGKTNEGNWERVPVDQMLPAGNKNGPIVAHATYRVPNVAEPLVVEREMQLTNIGLFTRVSPDSAIVWATRLTDGTVLSGARVQLYSVPNHGQPALLSSGTVDAAGLVYLPIRRIRPGAERLAVVVEHGDDWAYQVLEVPAVPEPLGQVFSARGIYRPGETVEIKGLFRVPITTGLVTPVVGEINVYIEDSTDRKIAQVKTNLTKFGTFSATLSIPEDAALGYSHLVAEFGQRRVGARLAIDHYRPIENKAFASVDKPAYIAGERMTCTARGEHLYGAPMSSAATKIVMSRGSATFNIPGLNNFSVGMYDYYPPSARLSQASGQLDKQGSFALSVSTALPGQVTTESITCDVEIADLDQRAQVAQDSAIVHPAEVYVALENPQEMWIDPGTTLEPKALVVTPAGERRAMPAHIEMVYRTRRDDRTFDDKVLGSCDVTTGQTPVGCSFVTPKKDPEADDEIRIVGTTKDKQGRTATSSYVHRINSLPTPPAPIASNSTALPPPPLPPPPPPPPPAEAPPRLTMEMNGPFVPGKTAHIVIGSSFSKPAKALVTLEREGILDRRTVELPPHPKKYAFDLPVTAAMMPVVHGRVTAILDNKVETADYAVLTESGSQRLAVDVYPGKTKAAPGETLNVDVAVHDAAGKPASGVEVTLWAADEGSLELTYYRTPDPWYVLFSDRDHLVDTVDARQELLSTFMGRHRSKPPSIRMGATSISPRRGDFRQTVAFFPNLVTGMDGRVKQKIKLPDGLTAYRFMAVAIAETDQTGSGDATVQTSKPFMAKPVLPLVVRPGDEFDASVVLSTLDRPAGKVTIETKTQGLSAVGSSRKTVDLAADAPLEVTFPVRADRVGKALFSVDATFSSDKHDDTDAVDLATRMISPMPLEKAFISGQTETAIAEKIASLPGIRKDTGGVSISFSSSPLTGIVTGMEQLVEYPYGCTEQTVSRLVPLLALKDLADAFGVTLENRGRDASKKEVSEALQRAVDNIVANQQRNGGFGLWPNSHEMHPWVTAYALWGLSEAQRRGLGIPKDTLERAVQALEPTLKEPALSADGLKLEQAAFAYDVLAGMGRKNEERLRAFFAQRARLSVESKAFLLHAYALALPEARNEMTDLALDISNALHLTSKSAYVEASKSQNEFSSDVMATSLALRALLAFDPKHPLAPALSAYLLQSRNGGKYATTHDAAWALLGLDAYRRTLPAPKDQFNARVFFGDRLLEELHFRDDALAGRTVHVPMQDIAKTSGGPFTFQVLGRGFLHYDITLNYAREALPTQGVDAGFYVTKSFRRVAEFGEATTAPETSEAKFLAGEVVVCEVEVVTPAPRSFVVLEDPLPGGLEPITFNYREAGAWLAKLEASPADRREKRDDRMVYFVDHLPAGITRFRYVARAMHTGRFLAPPTRIEQMYEPTIFGHTAAKYVRIAPANKP